MWILALPLQHAFMAQSMPCKAMGQKVEGSPTTTDEFTLPSCFNTLQSELAADNDQLGGNQIFNILMQFIII
jgi:hypothetical protein